MPHTDTASVLTVQGPNGSTFRLFKAGYGCYHTLVCGGTAARRESLLSTMLMTIPSADPVKVWLARGSEETESLTWVAPDREATTADGAYKLIVRAQGIIAANLVHNESIRWRDSEGEWVTGLDVTGPTLDRPLVLLALNIPLIDPKVVERVADIAKRGRKGGVALLIVAEDGSLASLGGAYGNAIRSNLAMGNKIFL